MATKRQHPQSANKPATAAAGKPPTSSAGHPTISVRAERTAQSLADERSAMTMRRAKLAGAVAVPAVLVAGLLLFFRPFAQPTAAPAVQALPTAAPAAQALPTAALAAPAAQALPTAVPTAQTLPSAAPAVAAPQPAAAPACEAIAGLPVFASATCVERDVDSDDGALKAKNTYTAAAAADNVRRFYEDAFTSGGWALQEFSYEVNLGARHLHVQVEIDQGVSGPLTKIKLSERGAAAGARTTCTAIDGLPSYPGAACQEFDTDQDDGVLKVENSYTTSASPEEVRRFYADAFASNGWAGHDFAYEVAQGQRRLQIDVEAQAVASGALTEMQIAEK
jgi:hypothetical protein